MSATQHIVGLDVENIKRIKLVRLKPDGSLVVIGGANEQGKTSLLDAIEMVLAGAKSIPQRPVREGASKAKIVASLKDLTITRTFSAAGSRLEVLDSDGKPIKSPQAFLDRLAGNSSLCFDPLRFAREDARAQAEMAKQALGLDFTAEDAERAKLFDERTDVGREGKSLKAQLDACPHYDDAPASETSAAEVMAGLRKAQEHNAANTGERRKLEQLSVNVYDLSQSAEACEERIKTLRQQLRDAESELADVRKVHEAAREQANAQQLVVNRLEDNDLSIFESRAQEVETANAKVRANAQHAKLAAQVESTREAYAKLTRKIEAVDERKRKAISEAKLPVDGLTFDDEGLKLKGIPFAQCSGAQKLRVSVAVGLALNPELGVVLIRDGSLLDAGNLAMISEMAEKAGAQVWMERVGDGSECTVVLEDGEIRDAQGKLV